MGVFNVAKGKAGYYATQVGVGNAALVVVLLQSAGLQADGTMSDHDTLAAVLAAANDEATFTNYTRKTITSAPGTVDDTNDRLDVDIADQTWTAAGGASNNTLGSLLVCYDPDTTAGTDTSIIPLTFHAFSATTDGNDLQATIAAAGFYRAA